METFGQQRVPNELRLFYRLLQAEFENCGNKHTSGPIAHGVHINDSYDNMHPLVKHVQYDKYSHICGT
jgi:hypothetical protein